MTLTRVSNLGYFFRMVAYFKIAFLVGAVGVSLFLPVKEKPKAVISQGDTGGGVDKSAIVLLYTMVVLSTVAYVYLDRRCIEFRKNV